MYLKCKKHNSLKCESSLILLQFQLRYMCALKTVFRLVVLHIIAFRRSQYWSFCGDLFSVRTPPTPPNHQLQWTPPEFLDSNGLQWVYIENIQEVITTELL